MKLFISPHSDDETLFGAFTILRERPLVLIVTDDGNPALADLRRAESMRALYLFNAPVEFLGFREDRPLDSLAKRLAAYDQPEMVYAPAPENGGHHHHNLVGEIARGVFRNVQHYMTYTVAGKSSGIPVPFEIEWPLVKLKALACYESQVNRASCQPHFLREQAEYYAA